MENDKDIDESQSQADQAAEAAAEVAAFEASFEGASVEAVTTSEPAAKQEPTQEAAVEPKATEAAPTAPSPKAEGPDVQAELRKLHGRIGSLNDQLQQALKAKETEGKPAVLSPVALTRLKDQYPELADMLEGDISEVIANLAQKSVDPKEIQQMVSAQLESAKFAMRQEAITDRHESWATDCWADQVGGTRTPSYAAWLKTMKPEDADAFENSQSPAFVNRKLDQFYDWKSKTAQAAAAASRTETEKQQRLKDAITPRGTARANPQTTSEDEAERKAFQDAYDS